MQDVGGACQATHEEVCNQALKHYEQISTEVCHWNSLVPEAIKYYRDNYKKDTVNYTEKKQPLSDMTIANELVDRGIPYLSFYWNLNGEAPELMIIIPDTVGYAKWESFRAEFMAAGWLVSFVVK